MLSKNLNTRVSFFLKCLGSGDCNTAITPLAIEFPSVSQTPWLDAPAIYPASTHWRLDKMAAISQTTLSNTFSWMKIFEFRLKFHWSLFPRIQLTIFQHWFRLWLGADQATSHYLNQWWLDHWCTYASLGLNELMTRDRQGLIFSFPFASQGNQHPYLIPYLHIHQDWTWPAQSAMATAKCNFIRGSCY